MTMVRAVERFLSNHRGAIGFCILAVAVMFGFWLQGQERDMRTRQICQVQINQSEVLVVASQQSTQIRTPAERAETTRILAFYRKLTIDSLPHICHDMHPKLPAFPTP